jgi:4'-phosphopantetheinyl transferase
MLAWDLRSAAEHPALDLGEPPTGFLSAPERAYFERLKMPRRRREWLLGRWAAKALCLAWLRDQGREVGASALTIAPDDDGAPFALLPSHGRLPITISLSHRDRFSLCVMTDTPNAPLGADLELCEPRSQAFVHDFFTAREEGEIAASRDPHRAATELWSLKESALKALRLGLRADTRSVQAHLRVGRSGSWDPTRVEVALIGAPERGVGFVRDEGDYLASVVWLGPGPMVAPSDRLRGGAVLAAPGAQRAQMSDARGQPVSCHAGGSDAVG